MKQFIALALVAVFSLSQVACTKDEVTATLGALVNAAIAAADIAFPQDAAILNQVTSACVDPALSILESSETGAQKSIDILAACTPMVALLGHNTVLQAVSAALASFLDSVRGLTAEAVQTPAGALAFAGSTSAAKVNKAELKKLRAQVAALKAKLAAKKR